MHLVNTDEELAAQADYILSIVPPRDALATAQRVFNVATSASFNARSSPLYYLDLNAVSPRSARAMEDLFKPVAEKIRLIDGGIIGPPPRPKEDGSWVRPSIPLSGPFKLSEARPGGPELAEVLNTQHVSDKIGGASGLKMCFASLTKGFTALAIQSFTTAHRLNVLPELAAHLERYSPKSLEMSGSITGMPPKAYRWVREMEEIGATFAEDGGFEDEENIFNGIARTYELVANGTELGKEKTERRVNGKTREDVARLMSEGIEKRKSKTE